MLPEPTLQLDSVDCAFLCHRLRWQRSSGEFCCLNSVEEFGLIPVDSIRGFVHNFRENMVFSATSIGHPRRRECDLLRNGEEGDMTHLVYVNRFFKLIGDGYDFGESVAAFFDEDS